MKNIKIITLTAGILCLSILFGCGIKKDRYDFGDDSIQITGDEGVQINTSPLYGIEDYYIVRSDLASDTEKSAMMALKDAVKKRLDIDLTAATDFIGGGQEEHAKEIIVGNTERKESKEAAKGLAFGDFVIKKSGDKIVIVGGSANATRRAVDFFIANCINVYGGCLNIPVGDGYAYDHDYMFNSLSIDGADIAEFSLYALPGVDISGVSEHIAENVYGVLLPVAESMSESGKYIIFDNTGFIANGFSVEVKHDGNLYVTGSVDTIDYAIEYFKSDFFKALEKKSSDCNIAVQDNYTGNVAEMPDFMSRDEIISKLEGYISSGEGFLSGEQGGSGASPEYISETFSDAVGKAPDIICIDLFSYGLHIDEMSDAELSEIFCNFYDYAKSGGIISVSAYFENPTGNWSLGDKVTGDLSSKENWIALITDGSDLNKKFRRQLDCAAEFLKALGDNGITAVFKPLESMNSDKYWYSSSGKGASVNGQIALWRYVYDYITGKGVTSLIWQFSPNITEGSRSLFDAYPGDEYVDMIGGVWTDVGVKTVSDSYAEGVKKLGKSVGAVTLTVSPSKISSGKDGQLALFSCRDLTNAVLAAKKSAAPIPAILTFGISSSPSWLGDGNALAEAAEQ